VRIIVLIFQKARREAVAKSVTISVFVDPGLFDRSADRFLNGCFGRTMTARLRQIDSQNITAEKQ
jgi:hypothetical protein